MNWNHYSIHQNQTGFYVRGYPKSGEWCGESPTFKTEQEAMIEKESAKAGNPCEGWSSFSGW